MKITLRVNGTPRDVDVDDDMPLVWILRDTLALTGTKFGCGVGVCGSCTVLENGKAIRSCQIPAHDAKDRSFTTIEGFSRGNEVTHPIQLGWLQDDVPQCGYCQPGMIMNACSLLAEHPDPSDAQIDAAMSDSVCRCGTYSRMRKCIVRVARELREHAP